MSINSFEQLRVNLENFSVGPSCKVGVTAAIFKTSGITPVDKDVFTMLVNTGVSKLKHSFITTVW